MRRVGIFLLAVIALVAMAGPVSAQPTVTIRTRSPYFSPNSAIAPRLSASR